jgi:hypothetical protein
MEPLTILAALGPLAVDLGKTLISRYVVPNQFKPATIDDYAKMKQIDIDLFKAINEAGGSNPSYPWVEAVVRMQRPLVAVIVLGTWAYLKLNSQQSEGVDNFASCIGFYLFGDRTLFYSRQNK